ncbi:sensor histidine kinase [Archangium sp.]|jgi:signal transduction histidine kinase|uniref:sensor histidine kinase n=1 Tax=Archangium sp. TaxID=1872627 RepID=UPI002ED9E2CA
MSALAMASRPRMTVMSEVPSHLSVAGPLDGTDVQSVDLGALVKHAVALLQATGHVKEAEVQVELPHEPVCAWLSRRRLEQVLFHLITHAVNAQRGEGTSVRAVRVTVEPQDDFGDYGPTFRVRYAERARAEQETAAEGSRETDLAVARELLESLGGRLTAKSHGLTGRTLSVELPDQGTASW